MAFTEFNQKDIDKTFIAFNQTDIEKALSKHPRNGTFYDLKIKAEHADTLRKVVNKHSGACDLICNHATDKLTNETIKSIAEFLQQDKDTITEKLVPYSGTHILEQKSWYRFFQLLICTIFRYYPDSPDGFHWDHWSLNALLGVIRWHAKTVQSRTFYHT